MYPPHHVRSVSPPEAQGSTCLEEVPYSPQCGSTPAFQLKVILRHQLQNLRSGCTHRAILVDAYHNLRRMQSANLEVQAHPHRPLARHNPSNTPCHPLMYNPSREV